MTPREVADEYLLLLDIIVKDFGVQTAAGIVSKAYKKDGAERCMLRAIAEFHKLLNDHKIVTLDDAEYHEVFRDQEAYDHCNTA
jgi:hypothetical protein